MGDGHQRLPFATRARALNTLYDEGHYICFFTARTDDHREATEKWLKKHDVKYNTLIFNKPRKIGEYTEYHWIDNSHVRATTYKGKFTNFKKKLVEIERARAHTKENYSARARIFKEKRDIVLLDI